MNLGYGDLLELGLLFCVHRARVNISLELGTVLDLDPRCRHIPINDSGGLKHDLFSSDEIALDFSLDGDDFPVDIRFDFPGLADDDLTFCQVNHSLDSTVYRQIFFPGNFPFDLHTRPDDRLMGLCLGFTLFEGRKWSTVVFVIFSFSSHENQSNTGVPKLFVTVITKSDSQ